MHLLSSLNAGFAAAGNGWAEIYVRGTNTRATWYASFEGDSPNSTGSNITLDAYGSALVYVNQLVDVVVKASDGVEVRSYGDGAASPNVEVVSQSFTGTDYVTASSGPSEPTTAQAVLDLWKTNSGSIDWKVLIDGSATTMLNAFGALSGLVFNVKSPAYGAVGDGVTNDQTAIAAALAAAVAVGGGTVYFPKGTYLISTAIEWAPLVNILGAGPGASIIKTSSASNARILTFTTGSAHTKPLFIAGLAFDASVSNTGEQLYASGGIAVMLDVYRCRFGNSSNCAGDLVRVASGGRVKLVDCEMVTAGSARATYIAADCEYHRCRFSTANTSFNNEFARCDAFAASDGKHDFVGCTFDASTVSSAPATLYGIQVVGGNVKASVAACHFMKNAQAFNVGIYNAVGAVVTASGNSFLGCTTRYGGGAIMGSGSRLEMDPHARTGSASATPTIPDGVAEWTFYSTGTDPAIALPTAYHPGQKLDILVWNNSGGNWTTTGVTFTGTYSNILTTVTTVNNGIAKWFRLFVSDAVSAGTYKWHIVDKTA